MNDIDAAINELHDCLENYPDDPVRVQVRLTLARARQEKKQWDKAANLLTLNLDDIFNPGSQVYRDSLYELGRIYDYQQNNAKTISVFEDFLSLYPNDPISAEVHYMIAKTNMNEEEKINGQIEEAKLSNQVELLRKTLGATQRKALDHLKQARTVLLQQEGERGLNKAEERMMRNTYFMIGHLLTAMGSDYYDESLQENRTAVTRYQGHPDVLQAYLQLASIYQLQNQRDQSDQIISQAKSLFQQFRATGAFRQETVYSEQQWQDMFRGQ